MPKTFKWAVVGTVAACSLCFVAPGFADDKIIIGFSQARTR